MLKLTLPSKCLYILFKLQEAGFSAYLVGGSVRDLLAQALGDYDLAAVIPDYDFDYTTNARPEQMLALFPHSFCENKFGTVSLTQERVAEVLADKLPEKKSAATREAEVIPISQATRVHESLTLPETPASNIGSKNFEITTFRKGEKYETDNRHPSSLEWGDTLAQDLARRDFTINALALQVKQEFLEQFFAAAKLPEEVEVSADNLEVIDQYQGLKDLHDNLIRAIGEPSARFSEDGLRLMRAVRLSVQLNFGIEETTYAALKKNADLIKTISWERIRDELVKILSSHYPKEGIMLLEETGLLESIMPELLAMRGVAQSGHHLTDVWVHSLDSLAACPSSDPIVRLATLLHDVGKPATQKMLAGKYTFYNHQIVGAQMAKKIAQRLHLSKSDGERLYILVRHHMFHYEPNHTDASIRRFMRQVGLANLNDILAVREGDRLGSNARKTSWRLEEMKQRMIAQLHQPLQVRDLAIGGNELMTEFNLKPGPVLGRVLQALLEEVLEDAALNTKKRLLERAADLLKTDTL